MANSPTFISIGPGRCGTSWLYEILSDHPEVGMAKVKETEFFNTNCHKGVAWYENLFPAGSQTAIGEISNNYYLDQQVAARLAEYRPDMKLILSLRNPFSLLKSFYGFGQRRGLEPPELADFVDRPIGPVMGSGYARRQKSGTLTTSDTRTVLEAVSLGERFAPFYELFPAQQIYVLVYERIGRDPLQVVREIYDFLGVNREFQPDLAGTVVNQAVAPRSNALARLASRAAYIARAAGAYRLLRWGHRSPVVKRLLYTAPDIDCERPRGGDDVELPVSVRDAIRADLRRLSEIDPSLSTWIAEY